MFIWIVHRVTGILLIVLIALKVISGYGLAGRISVSGRVSGLHFGGPLSDAIDIGLIVLATFHALYGLRTMLVDLGVRRERALFWGFTGAGAVIVAVALLLLY